MTTWVWAAHLITFEPGGGKERVPSRHASTSTPNSPGLNRTLLSRQSLPAMSGSRPAALDLKDTICAEDVIITPLNNVPGQCIPAALPSEQA